MPWKRHEPTLPKLGPIDMDFRRRKIKKPYPISFSIAYTRAAEWVKDSNRYPKPDYVNLKRAMIHAERLKDYWLLGKMQELWFHYEEQDRKSTPRRPGRTKVADEISSGNYSQPAVLKISSEQTQDIPDVLDTEPVSHRDIFSGEVYSIVCSK